ncbi:hypothetical protein SS50377_23647 [Spironucleus salmonicida]|uniref:Uncharacterized protein n=1 Tax=Spironucleus salmonicida TaxID=348837 RepID=V6LY32_9EUKA|nr:hypothetical protein SS50377_23647 [Spironucleus salmonicida]|eukprot:EST48631.1 Hypothetical protein SS50377_11243 [Spironucleus salmonicida]
MIPQFDIKEHDPCNNQKQNFSSLKPSLFAQQAQNGPPKIFKCNIQQKPIIKQKEIVEAVTIQDIHAHFSTSLQEAEYILQATSSKSSSVRGNAFVALSGLLKQADLPLLRWFYHSETSPVTQAFTLIEKYPKDAQYPLQLISEMAVGDENYINELALPFIQQFPKFIVRKQLGVFHDNIEFGLEVLSNVINNVGDESRNLIFLIFERFYTNQKYITDLFEGEVTLQLEQIKRNGNFLNMAGRIALRNIKRPGLDFSVIELLMANYDDSIQGYEILQVLVMICAYVLNEEREDEITLFKKFVSQQKINSQTQKNNIEQLSKVAYILKVQIDVDDTFLDETQLNLEQILTNYPFFIKNCEEYLRKTDDCLFDKAISAVFDTFNHTQLNNLSREKSLFLEIQAPQIRISDHLLNKISFLHLFNKQQVDSSLPKSFYYLTNAFSSDIDYLSQQYDYKFTDERVLNSYEAGYIGVFMLQEFKFQKFSSLIKKLGKNAQDLSFILNLVNTLDDTNQQIPTSLFDLFDNSKLSLFSQTEVFTKGKIYKKFYSVYFEFMLSLIQQQIFMDYKQVEKLIFFADISDIELQRVMIDVKKFYNIQ